MGMMTLREGIWDLDITGPLIDNEGRWYKG